MRRKLLRAAVYREFLFPDANELRRYLEGGHADRWLVSTKEDTNGIIAVIGEQYNGTEELKMRETEERK